LIDGERPLKSALRTIIEKYQLAVQLTAEQDLILHGIRPQDKREIETYLDTQGLKKLTYGAYLILSLKSGITKWYQSIADYRTQA
jgi:sulfite reductase beta subunit-like hemoprotein